MVALNELRELRKDILDLARRHGARNVRIFGSVVQPGAAAPRDIDFLVELQPGRSLLDHVALWQDLEALLGCPVDVVDERGLSPFLKERILAQARAL